MRVIAHHLEGEVRDIDHHVSAAKVARQPAPALHIGKDALDLLDGLGTVDGGQRLAVDQAGRLDIGARLDVLDGVEQRLVIGLVARLAADAEALAQRRHARVLGARLDDRAVWNAIVDFGARRGVAQLGEFFLQGLEAAVRRIEAVERRVGVVGVRDLLEHVGRLRQMVAVFDFDRNAGRRDAADRQVTGKGQHRIGELDVAVGERLRPGEAAELRHRIIGRVEPFGGGVLEPRDHGLGARRELAIADPQRRVAARGVERLDRLALGHAIDALLDLLGGDEVAQLVGDLRVAGGKYLVEQAPDGAVAGVGIARRFCGRGRCARPRLGAAASG